jgi:hypothetical protein
MYIQKDGELIKMRDDWRKGYYYLHANSQIVYIPSMVVAEEVGILNEKHVIKHWYVESELDFNKMIDEAKLILLQV